LYKYFDIEQAFVPPGRDCCQSNYWPKVEL